MRFRVLGPLQVATGPGWAGIRASQQRLVLALLLMETGRPVATDRIVDELWGENPPATAVNTVQAYVARLRRALPEPRVLVTRSGGYELAVDPDDVDARVFERLVADGRRSLAAGRLEDAAGQLSEALALWRGPPFGDVPATPMVAAETAQLERLRLTATEMRMSTELRLGRHVDVVAELSRLVDEHPLVEALRGQLMLALYRSGRRGEALETYRRGRALLASELGIEPTRELADLHQAILDDDRSLTVIAKGDAPADEPVARPGQLPADIVDFSGRHDLLELVEAGLTAGPAATAVPVVALTGRAGVGKTTLAVHVAHRLRTSFPDGQLYVDLHGVDRQPARPADVLARFLIALGMDGRALPSGQDERAESLRTLLAGRRILMVLDNAANEQQIRPLLPGSPSCSVLVTSRRRLTGLNARWLGLDELDTDSALSLLAGLAGLDRVRDEPVAARQVVELCDHLPLAVRVAGARLAARPQWTISRFADRLADEARRLDELATGDLAVPASVGATYAALSPEAARAFRLLGLLDAADFAAWVPAALLDIPVPRAESLLDVLIDAHLVACVDTPGGLRFRLHDLVRLFARERADAEDSDQSEAFTRVLGAWLALADAADSLLTERVVWDIRGSSPRRPVDFPVENPLSWFDDERAALVSAVRQASAAGLAGHAWELSARAVNYFAFRGHYDDWLQTHSMALHACADDRLGAAVMTRNLSYLRMTGVRIPPDIDVGAALSTFTDLGERHGEVDMRGMLAWGYRHRGAITESVTAGDSAMVLAQAIGYEMGQSRLWYLRATTAREQGRYAEAAVAARECLELAEHVGSVHDRVLALWEVAGACRDDDSATRALGWIRRGVKLCHQRGERLLAAYLRLATADLYLRFGLGDPRSAIAQALPVFARHKVLLGQIVGLRLLGTLDHRDPAGIMHLTRAARLADKVGNNREAAMARKALGTAYYATGATMTAIETWQEALEIFELVNDHTEAATVRTLLYEPTSALSA